MVDQRAQRVDADACTRGAAHGPHLLQGLMLLPVFGHSVSMWCPQSEIHAAIHALFSGPTLTHSLLAQGLWQAFVTLSARHALNTCRTYRPQLVVADGVIIAGKACKQQRNLLHIYLRSAAAAR